MDKRKTSHGGGEHVRASHSFSPSSASLPFFRLYFHSCFFPRWRPGVPLFPMATCLFLHKQTPHAPVSSFSHISPLLLSHFSVSSAAWFTLSRTTLCPSITFSPLCPFWSDGLQFWEGNSALCGSLSSAGMTRTGNHLCTPPHIPTSAARVTGFR